VPEMTDAQLDQLIIDLGLRPRLGPGARAACGTPAGYRRHRRDGEERCQRCLDAKNTDERERARRGVKKPEKLPPIAHGTPQGARQHWYRKDPICAACKDAYNADQNERRRRARAARRGEA
jgi:hypothetical protein